jgi:hypothetical protein
MNRKTEIFFLMAFIFQITSKISVLAFCCEPHPSVCAQFFHSDEVFIGKVISSKIILENDKADFNGGWQYSLNVQKVFRGPVVTLMNVMTGNDSDSFQLEKGHTYLLFAHYDSKNYWIGDECGNNADLSENSNIEGEVKKIAEGIEGAPGGEISGLVSHYPGDPSTPYMGVEITVQGLGKTYFGKTGKDGWFHIMVPIGDYSVNAKFSQETIVPFDLSYDNPKKIHVEKGGCYEIQFVKENYGSN